MEDLTDPNKCRCEHWYCYLKAKYIHLQNHTKSNKLIAALPDRNIRPLTKMLNVQRAVRHQ